MPLKRHDLKDTILPYVSVDEFKSKTGRDEEVIVVALYFINKEPARELSSFIEKGYLDILDTEASPNPDRQGHHVVFVEIKRNDAFEVIFRELLNDVENATDKVPWTVSIKGVPGFFKVGDPELSHYLKLVTDPSLVDNFVKESYIFDYHIQGRDFVINNSGLSVKYKILDFNDGDKVIAAHETQAVAETFYKTPEYNFLKSAFGNEYNVLESKDKLFIEKDNQILVLEKAL